MSTGTRPSAAQRARIEALLRQRGIALPDADRIPRAAGPGPYPSSSGQRRMWMLDQLADRPDVYSMPSAWRLLGRLDEVALRHALDEIVRRHEVLRSVLVEHGDELLQAVQLPARFALERVVLDGDPGPAEIARRAAAHAASPFDLRRGPLARATLLVLTPTEHVLLFTMHHAVSDGQSIEVMIRELAALYLARSTGGQSPLPELTVQYHDYAVWQRSVESTPRAAEGLAFWTDVLAGVPRRFDPPTDRPRPPARSDGGGTLRARLSPSLTTDLRDLCKREQVTLFMALLAGYGALLSRWSGQDQVVIGVPVANRPRPELQDLIGCFVNTMAMPVDLRGAISFRDLLRRVRATALAAYAHQDTPFERVVEALQPERDLSRAPLFQVVFVLQERPVNQVALGELTVARLETSSETAKFDLSLSVCDVDGALEASWEYSTDLFVPATIERLAHRLEALLAAAVAAPDLAVSELDVPAFADRVQATALEPVPPEAPARAAAAPSTPIEVALLALWRRLLERDDVGLDTDFFTAGGHSLLAGRLLAEISQTFGVTLRMRALYVAPTVAELAPVVAAAAPSAASGNSDRDAARRDASHAAGMRLGPAGAAPPVIDTVVLTGATGFLGAFLLAELVRTTSWRIVCLVRAASPELAAERLQRNLERYRLWRDEMSTRLLPVAGDLERARLGLGPKGFRDLAASVHAIFHNGAVLDGERPYADLRAANVLGTREVIRLALDAGGIPLHYVSTLSVFEGHPGPRIAETDEAPEQPAADSGYALSKWAAERIVRQIGARGLPITVHRVGRVVGDSRTGACSVDDIPSRFLRGCAQLGCFPDLAGRYDMTPVDFVSRAIVALARQPESIGRVFHLVNPTPGRLVAARDALRAAGFAVDLVDYPEWVAALERALIRGADNALAPLASMFQGAAVKDEIAFDCRHTTAALETAGAQPCPPVDQEFLRRTIEFLVAAGALP